VHKYTELLEQRVLQLEDHRGSDEQARRSAGEPTDAQLTKFKQIAYLRANPSAAEAKYQSRKRKAGRSVRTSAYGFEALLCLFPGMAGLLNA